MTKALRNAHRRRRRLSLVQAPRLLEDFNFSLSPMLPAERFRQLQASDFVAAGEHVLIFGGKGSGKTHLLETLASRHACNRRAVFVLDGPRLLVVDGTSPGQASASLLDLIRGQGQAGLHDALLQCDLLLVDELPELRSRETQWLADLFLARMASRRSLLIGSRDGPVTWLRTARFGQETPAVLTQANIFPAAPILTDAAEEQPAPCWHLFATGGRDNSQLFI